MKVRKGFVSNSSSSSFVCDISGESVTGMDYSLTDCDMVCCVNNHTFLYDGYPFVEEWVNDSTENDEDEDCSVVNENGENRNEGDNYGLPERICPICNGDTKVKAIIVKRLSDDMNRLHVTANDILNYKES